MLVLNRFLIWWLEAPALHEWIMPMVRAFSPVSVVESVAVWEDSFAYWCKEIFPDTWWYSRTSNPCLPNRQTRLSDMILHWNVHHCDPRLSVHQSCIQHRRSNRAFDHEDFQVPIVSASELVASFGRVPRREQICTWLAINHWRFTWIR